MFEEANSEFLDHKSAEKFVSFDQINYKRVLETESFKERRIGEFFFNNNISVWFWDLKMQNLKEIFNFSIFCAGCFY